MRAQIAERKAEILALLRRRSSSNHIAAPPIRPSARGAPALLSFAQERLWFLEQLEPESAVYNICRASRLLGNLSSPALEASLNEIVSRHETLRTAFRLIDGTPVQVVQRAEGISIDFTDLRSVPKSERDANIRRQIEAAALHPFDLNSGLLLRCALTRVDEQEHILVLTTHHSAADAWSMGILTRELWTLYDAFSNGRPSPLEPLPVQYSDYAVWQREWLQGDMLEAQLAYWKERLKDLSILNLPTDRPRKPRQSFHGARVAIELPHELTNALNEMSHRFAVTPFMTLLAAFQVLLYRYTGQEDAVVGSPVANRRRPEIEGLIGFFVNTLVLRADLSRNPSFSELLLRVRDVCVGADANQDLPFEKLVQELQPERDQSRNPLFQVMFVVQNATRPFTGIPGLRVEPLQVATRRSAFDLSLFLREREGKYIGHFEYSNDLFDRDRIERMAGHFQSLLEVIIADPDQPISLLAILTEAERHQILVEWNATAADYPKHKCIHQLFEEQVERTPEAIALEFDDQQITYRELNRRANQLAHYLIGLGVEAEKRVGIRVERSIEMVVALLGILKAGGAYVPLDPAYPQERLRFMLEDAQVSVLLTKQKVPEERGWPVLSEVKEIDDRAAPEIANGGYSGIENRYPPSSIPSGTLRTSLGPRFKVICLERDWPLIAQQRDDNPNQAVNSDNLSYVIYTSGSTGTPKGVAIEHRNTVNLLYWAKSTYGPSDLAGVLASTSICFDLSVFEIFVPLSWGGKIILVENALSLRERPDRGITLVNTVPSVITQVLALGRLPASVQVVNLAGEPLNVELVNRLYEEPSVQRVHDLYGPSETTTYSTFTLRYPDGLETIGRPIANTQIYILDAVLQPIATGVEGELYIGGAGVARGYLNRSELTTEMFIADPFGRGQRSQLYRTGDRGRYLPDGNIEFIGRMDSQLKVRGYRIEPGEIEATLTKHPTVKDCVVVACEHQSRSGKDLVGYVVRREQSVFSGTKLRSYLQEKLPEYMIPSSFVVLEALPLMPNGKVDRNRLPLPDGTRLLLTKDFILPRTEIEELIAQTWREVLKIENVGIFDNLFELGGHSLLATQIVARLQEAFNKNVPLRVLFDAPTIAELAQELEPMIRDGRAPARPPIVLMPRDGPPPLSMNQDHIWHLDQMMPNTHFFNMPYCYHLKGTLNVEALERAVTELVRRHEALRTIFREVAGSPVQIVEEVSRILLQTIDLRLRSPDEASYAAAEFVLQERSTSFDLSVGPLCRVKLLRLTDTEAFLLVTVHHAISDHWSMQVFYSELIRFYESFQSGSPAALPEPKIQFGHYALWERRMLDTGQFNEQANYWKNQLTESCAGRQLHTEIGITRPLVAEFARQPIDINEHLLRDIRDFASKQYCTPFMVVLSAVFVMARFILAEPRIRVATLMANRRRLGAETAIGHFVNTIIITSSVSPGDTFVQLVRRIRRRLLAAYERQEFPFEQLACDIEKEHGFGRHLLAPVLFNYRKRAVTPISMAGLIFAPCVFPTTVSDSELLPAAYDLIFDVRETSTELTGTVNVSASIAGQEGAKGEASNLGNILDVLVAEPTRTLSTLILEVPKRPIY